jgi:hypothetical protein
LAAEQVKALAPLRKRRYVESDEICLLDGPPSKRARYTVNSSVPPESPIKTEADRQKKTELDDLFKQKSALHAEMRSIEAKILSFGEVSQLLPSLAESLPITLLAER